MDKNRIMKMLFRLDNFADRMEKDAAYIKKSVAEVKKELKKEGLI
jgi:hypothetical protein